MSCLKSAGESSRPFRRIVRSSSCAFEAADRRRQVLRLQRLHHLPDADARRLEVARPDLDDQLALDRAGRGSPVATPVMPRSRRVMPGSAMRVSSAPVRPGDDSVSETIGRSAGSNCVRIGSSISVGRSLRMPEILSRISCVATRGSFE